jgi:hypothetical protein
MLVTFAFVNSFINHANLLPNTLVSSAFYVGDTIITLCFFFQHDIYFNEIS